MITIIKLFFGKYLTYLLGGVLLASVGGNIYQWFNMKTVKANETLAQSQLERRTGQLEVCHAANVGYIDTTRKQKAEFTRLSMECALAKANHADALADLEASRQRQAARSRQLQQELDAFKTEHGEECEYLSKVPICGPYVDRLRRRPEG